MLQESPRLSRELILTKVKLMTNSYRKFFVDDNCRRKLLTKYIQEKATTWSKARQRTALFSFSITWSSASAPRCRWQAVYNVTVNIDICSWLKDFRFVHWKACYCSWYENEFLLHRSRWWTFQICFTIFERRNAGRPRQFSGINKYL